MVERYGGKGGFGAIASDNTDMREGPDAPHRNVSRWTDPMTRIVQVFCFDCAQRWEYKERDPWGKGPSVCEKTTT